MSTNNAINAPKPFAPTVGGTGLNTYTLGDTIYCSSSNVLLQLAGNTTSTKKFYSQTGTGSASAAPIWDTISSGDISGLGTMALQNANNVNISGGQIELTGNLEVAPGTITTPPLTFQSGTNLTIPVAGVVEFDGSNFFFSTSAGRRQAVLSNVTTASNGKVPIGNGTDFTLANITGTSNQITVSNGSGTIGLSLPQDIATNSSVQFGALTLGNSSGNTLVVNTSTLVVDATNKRVGIGTASPATTLHVTRASATSSGVESYFRVDQVADISQTASTESPTVLFNFDSATRTWAAGSLSTQRFFKINQPTIAFASASTATTVATLGIVGAPVQGTNATLTNSYGILVSSASVSTATNSYGLSVTTQSGATNNYCATFMSGYVGIGITAPTATLHVDRNLGGVGSADPYLRVTPVLDATIPAGTESPIVDFNFTASSRQWSTGSLTLQRNFLISSSSVQFVGASTVTNLANLGIAGCSGASTNATITNTHAILVSSNAISGTPTNSYGLSVNASSGATNNYAAQFMGGNVGIGTASPTQALSVVGGFSLESRNAYVVRGWVQFNGGANSNGSGTYSRTSPSTTLTVTSTAHGLIAGQNVYLDFTSGTGADGSYTVVTVPDANTFTITTVASTTTSGNVTIRKKTINGSQGISSVADVATGTFGVNFTVAMPDTNYSLSFATQGSSNNVVLIDASATGASPLTTGYVPIVYYNNSASRIDATTICVTVVE